MASRSRSLLPYLSIPPCSCRIKPTSIRKISSSSKFIQPSNNSRFSSSNIGRTSNIRTLATHAMSSTAAATSPPSVPAGPTKAYFDQIEQGLIQPDDHQRSIITLLQSMYDSLETYNPPPIPTTNLNPPKPSFFSKLFNSSATTSNVPSIPENVPKGLYLYGSVGCGKSYLMDLFYANLPKKWENSKRRVHFHAFMMDVHQRSHRMKGEIGDEADWIVHAARELAGEARILCFDEFQVS